MVLRYHAYNISFQAQTVTHFTISFNDVGRVANASVDMPQPRDFDSYVVGKQMIWTISNAIWRFLTKKNKSYSHKTQLNMYDFYEKNRRRDVIEAASSCIRRRPNTTSWLNVVEATTNAILKSIDDWNWYDLEESRVHSICGRNEESERLRDDIIHCMLISMCGKDFEWNWEAIGNYVVTKVWKLNKP